MLMTEQAAILDDLLARWHIQSLHAKTVRGYSPTAAGFDQYRPSRQYDDANGALDGELDKSTLWAVDFAVSQLLPDHQAAIHQEARNLAAGREVFISPRLPKDRHIRHALIQEARAFLTKRLQNAGVL